MVQYLNFQTRVIITAFTDAHYSVIHELFLLACMIVLCTIYCVPMNIII